MGRFEPGHAPSSPGRPKGAAGLAAYIAEQTNGGQELVDRLLVISRTSTNPRQVEASTMALLDRLAGRPVQPVAASIQTGDSTGPTLPSGWGAMGQAEREVWLDQNLPLLPVRK